MKVIQLEALVDWRKTMCVRLNMRINYNILVRKYRRSQNYFGELRLLAKWILVFLNISISNHTFLRVIWEKSTRGFKKIFEINLS